MAPNNDKIINTEPEVIAKRRFRILRLLNYSVIAAYIVYAVMYAAIDIDLLYPLIIVLTTSIIPIFISLYYNKQEKYLIAGSLLCYTLSISLFITCIMVGGTPNFHHFFLLYLIICFLTAPLNHWAYLSSMIVTNLVFFVFIEFFYHPAAPLIQFPEVYVSRFNNSILLLIFLTLAVVLFYYKWITEKFEYLLKQQTQHLFSLNHKLEKQAEDMSELNTELEERQQQIEEQAEVLKNQKDGLEEANTQLQKLIATKDKFFSIIAHDLKNPIGGIMGFANLLEKNLEELSREKIGLYIKQISESVTTTFQLLEDLLVWARSQNSHLTFKPEPVVINPIIESNYKLLSEHANEKTIKMNLDYEQGAYIGYCDRNMIDTVIRNLMSNAIKFTTPGGEINIKMKEIMQDGQKKGLEISVTDTGIGISQEQLEHLFRIDKSSSTKGTAGEVGTGLGLILCKEFVEKHGGELHVKSEPGKGSTFRFTLPVPEEVGEGEVVDEE